MHELTKFIMVSKDKNFVFVAFQIVALSLKGFNNSQELLIISLEASLGEEHFSRESGYKVLLANFSQKRIWI